MGEALYRKHRPKTLNQVVGQKHITETLEHALSQGRISHAYLFTGPHGVGKTSVARIMAHEINKLEYTDDAPHMDIIEIDAASNRRIDEIRELRERVYVAPTSLKYKVYIIDEVHMLTREAFNALLKTLEEPPAHVVFILATTDSQKLPDTIISRTQRYSFKPVDAAEVMAHLKDIAKIEKLKVSDDALEMLAAHGEGSFRDSISMLDQAANYSGQLRVNDVQRLLGIPPLETIDALTSAIAASDTVTLIGNLGSLYDQGYPAVTIAKMLSKSLRASLINGSQVMSPAELLQLLARLIDVPTSHDADRYLEISLLQAISNRPNIIDQSSAIKAKSRETVATKTPSEPDPRPAKISQTENSTTNLNGNDPKTAGSQIVLSDSKLWPKVLNTLKERHNTLYSVVRMAEPRFSGDHAVELAFAFKFHQKRLSDTANKQLLAGIIQEYTGQRLKVTSVLDEKAKPPIITSHPAEVSTPSDLKAISNIFGSAELLES